MHDLTAFDLRPESFTLLCRRELVLQPVPIKLNELECYHSYLNATIDLPFILGNKGQPVVVNCYAGASFAFHKDKSHDGIAMPYGHDFVWCKSSGQTTTSN